MPDNLPELRDIHIPPAISEFPLGYGWCVLVISCIFVWILFRTIKFVIRKSKKRYALNLIKNIKQSNLQKSASAMSEVIRRICVYKYPQAQVLMGRDWIEFIQSHTKIKLDKKIAEFLVDAPYMPSNSKTYDTKDLEKLKKFCIQWIGENL